MRKLLALAAGAVVSLTLITAFPSLASLGGGGAGVSGPYPVDLNEQQDVCGHDEFIFRSPTGAPLSHNMTLQVAIDGTQALISGPNPWVTVVGDYNPATGAIQGQGMGTVAGFPNVTVTFDGALEGDVLTGKYAMGTQGELPPCGQPPAAHPAIYTVKPKPVTTPTRTRTPTRTPTPTEKVFSIIVLKQHADTHQPLAGWEFNLFQTSDCQGLPFDSGTTDADGMVDFLPLQPGTYSVEEKPQPGWNPVGDDCQNVVVGAAGLPAGLPPCPIQPDQDHPQPGCDTFFSGARVVVRINATGEETAVNLNGPTLIRRNNKPSDKDGDGLDEVNTEIVAMELTGDNITVRESASRMSIGLIEEQQNVAPGVLDFPANSLFDVFFEVDVGGMTLHNETPFRLACKIEEIPPYLCFYVPPIREPIILLNAQGVKIATLLHGKHIPLPPNEELLIFTNRPKGTPTNTPPGAATATPTAPDAVTATRTPTATPGGACEKTAQDVELPHNPNPGLWDLWKCFPDDPDFAWNRVDIYVGRATQEQKLRAVQFDCQSNDSKAGVVTLKGHEKDVNDDPLLPHHEIWSGEDFDGKKCRGGVTVGLLPVDPANHPVIKAVLFSNVPPPNDGDVDCDDATNSLDALIVLQHVAALLDLTDDPLGEDCPGQLKRADTDEDGDVTSIDAVLILQLNAGLLDMLPPAVGGSRIALW